jgi:hypothetical protein
MDLSTLIACLLLVTIVLALNRLLENRTTQIIVHSCTSFCDMSADGDDVVVIDEEEEGEGQGQTPTETSSPSAVGGDEKKQQ